MTAKIHRRAVIGVLRGLAREMVREANEERRRSREGMGPFTRKQWRKAGRCFDHEAEAFREAVTVLRREWCL